MGTKGAKDGEKEGPKNPGICHVHEMMMSETVEKLEGGGRRTGGL